MIHSAKFWITMTVFQVAFGLTVFAITRQYYIHDQDKVSANASVMAPAQPAPEWPEGNTKSELEQLISSYPGQPIIEDPVVVLNRADEFYTSGQYAKAADLYQQLLATGSSDVNTYNNLGITLYNLGRSDEALRILNEGVAVDSSYQRIWLTLGFVNSQLGNTGQARLALTTAVQMGADTEVGRTATEMLGNLP
jgi:tetratricopeptide (TPR) repeat protein